MTGCMDSKFREMEPYHHPFSLCSLHNTNDLITDPTDTNIPYSMSPTSSLNGDKAELDKKQLKISKEKQKREAEEATKEKKKQEKIEKERAKVI